MKRKRKRNKRPPRIFQPFLNDADTIARWNAQFRVDTMVIVTLENGKHVRARTTSLAYKPHPFSPVLIDLNRCSGVPLSRVESIEKGVSQHENAMGNLSRHASAGRVAV